MDIKLIEFFNAAIREDHKLMDAAYINKLAMQAGYIVDPAICTKSVYDFLICQDINYNSTFYKTWADVIDKTRAELLIDQIHHYITTYGTDFSFERGYVPNDNINFKPIVNFSDYKQIKCISEEELFNSCVDVLTSGIALGVETMESICNYVISKANTYIRDIKGFLNTVKNREALAYICGKIDLLPSENIAALRVIVYLLTGETMIIKNNKMYNHISEAIRKNYKVRKLLSSIAKNDDQLMVELSKIFLRYKMIFLAMKCKGTENFVNKLRRYAKKYHKPLQPIFWNNVICEEYPTEEITKQLQNNPCTTYKMVSILQAINERLENITDPVYIVRNQKIYQRKNYTPKNAVSIEYLKIVYTILYNYLLKVFVKNSTKSVITEDNKESQVAKIVKIPSNLTIALPTSEKSYIGNYPFGTRYKLQNHNFLGIYWKNEWNTRDFDLGCYSFTNHIAWNNDYYDSNIIFSGDMTNAEPEAAEVLAINQPETIMEPYVFHVNQYFGEMPSKFKLYFGSFNEKTKIYKNFMVNPADVKATTMVQIKSKQTTVGIISDGYISLCNLASGNRRVFNTDLDIITGMVNKINNIIDIRPLLELAGYVIVDETYTDVVDIDFSNPNKNDIINLMVP